MSRASSTPGGAIGAGLCVLLGVAEGDDEAAAARLAGRVARLRIFQNDEGKFDRSLLDTGSAALVVSQFTLIADTAKGNRPSFSGAARPELAEPVYQRFCVFVDHPQGVDHALCERVTNVLRSYLDDYSVEVSSPGRDRPLRTRAHFERAVGRTVRIKTESGRARGKVLSAGEKTVQISGGTESSSSDTVPAEIPYDEIVRANMIHEG